MPPPLSDDLDLMLTRAGMGDRAAFRQLYAATSGKLFAVVLRILKDRSAAEDVLQITFVKIWTHAKTYRPGGARPMTWLIAIARNAAIDSLRKRREDSGDEDAGLLVPDPAPGPEARAVIASDMARLNGCLETLEADRREAVLGAYLEGFSYEELAARHDVALNTMRSWLRRALISLRGCMS